MCFSATVTTERLELRPMAPEDATDLFEIFSDPAGWWYDPAGRHRDIETTRRFIERAAARWDRDGLSYWTARAVEDAAVIGLGGAQQRRRLVELLFTPGCLQLDDPGVMAGAWR